MLFYLRDCLRRNRCRHCGNFPWFSLMGAVALTKQKFLCYTYIYYIPWENLVLAELAVCVECGVYAHCRENPEPLLIVEMLLPAVEYHAAAVSLLHCGTELSVSAAKTASMRLTFAS